MAYKVIVTPNAHHEIDEAIAYISVHLGSRQAASDLFGELEAVFGVPETFPYAFAVDEAATDVLEHETRKTNVKRYRLFYQINENSHVISIISFLHSLQDVRTRLS